MYKHIILCCGLFAFLICGNQAWANCADFVAPQKSTVPLKSGINVTGWLGNWKGGPLLGESDASDIKKLGFTFVRLAVAPKHLEHLPDDVQANILRQLRCDIIGMLNENLSVVLDLHPVGKFHEDLAKDERQYERLVGIWKTLSSVISDLPPDRVYLNLLNEPIEKLPNWWSLQGQLVAALRELYPHNTFIVNAYYSSYKRLFKEKPYPDKKLLYDFHFYVPHFYTHHGVEWDAAVDPKERHDNIDYPVTSEQPPDADYKKMKEYLRGGWNKDKLRQEIKSNIDWAQKYGVTLVCMEFGVYKPYVLKEGRLRWLGDVRSLLEEYGVPWALWNYNGDGFGLIDTQREVDVDMLKVFGLASGAAP